MPHVVADTDPKSHLRAGHGSAIAENDRSLSTPALTQHVVEASDWTAGPRKELGRAPREIPGLSPIHLSH